MDQAERISGEEAIKATKPGRMVYSRFHASDEQWQTAFLIPQSEADRKWLADSAGGVVRNVSKAGTFARTHPRLFSSRWRRMPSSLDLHYGWPNLCDVVFQLNASDVDSTKVLPPSDPNHPCCDASWALGIGNVPAGGATVNLYVTSTPPSGFYLMQTNEITGDAVYLSAEMRANAPVPPTVPESSTLTLLGTGIAGFFGVYRFRKSRCSWHFVLRNTYESGKLLAIQFWV